MKFDVKKMTKLYADCGCNREEIKQIANVPEEYIFDVGEDFCVHIPITFDHHRNSIIVRVDKVSGEIRVFCYNSSGIKRETVNEFAREVLDLISFWKDYILFD